MGIFKAYSGGGLWARNPENIDAVKDKAGDPRGVYVLYDGSTPMYVGRGRIWKRLRKHNRENSSKSAFWDYFAWFCVQTPEFERDVEALMLRMLPFYLRILNKQRASLTGAKRIPHGGKAPIYVKRPKLLKFRIAKRRTRRKKR